MATVSYNPSEDEDEEEGGSGAANPVVQGSQAGIAGQQAPGSGQASASPGTDFTKSNFVSAKKLINANRGSQQADLTQPLRQQIDTAGQNLQKGFADYQAGETSAQQQAREYAAASGNVNKDEESFGKIKTLLSGGIKGGQYQQGADGFDAAAVNAIGTQAGAKDALTQQARKAGVANYGQGKAALDAAVFNSDPNARKKIQDLQEAQVGYGQQKADIQNQATGLANQTAQSIAEAQAQAKGQLSTQAQAIQDAATARAQDLGKLTSEQKIEILRNDPSLKKVLDQLTAQYGGNKVSNTIKQRSPGQYALTQRGEFESAIDKVINSLGDRYVKQGTVDGPAYNEEEVGQFNKIQELLGGTPNAAVAQAPKASVDVAGLSKKLDEAGSNVVKTREAKEARIAKDKATMAEAERSAANGMPTTAIPSKYADGSDQAKEYDKAVKKGLEKNITDAANAYRSYDYRAAQRGQLPKGIDRELLTVLQQNEAQRLGSKKDPTEIIRQYKLDKELKQNQMVMLSKRKSPKEIAAEEAKIRARYAPPKKKK